jgi:naphthalene 1,2-dioxygenase ferredoxin reductase component
MTLAVDASPDLGATLGHVAAIRDISPDVAEVLVVPSRPMTILPGQYLNVSFEGFPARAFCPTVCLHDPGCADALYFHIRRVPGGRVSAALGREIAGGHRVALSGPFGSAYLQPGLASRLVLVAEDTGFAPIWSIAAVALDEQPNRNIDLIVGSRDNGFYMQPALRWLAAFPNVTITCVAASAQEPSVLAGCPADHLPELFADDVIHVAGSSSTVAAVMGRAAAAGAVCHAEAFAADGAAEDVEPSARRSEQAPSESLLGVWRLRGPRPFARKTRRARRATPTADRAEEPGIRARRGLDLYLAGALAACSALVLSTLVLVDPVNTFGSAPPSGDLAMVGQAGAPLSATLPVQTYPVDVTDIPEPSHQSWPADASRPAALAASEDFDARLRSGASDVAGPAAEPTKDMVVAGVWAPDASACPSAQNRKRLIPAVITADGASAGDTFCAFRRKKQTDSGLDVVANCSNAKQKWTARVRLTVNGNRLVWASERGTQAYLRCEPNLRMAEAR